MYQILYETMSSKKIRHYYIETTDQEQSVAPTYREVRIVHEPSDRKKPFTVEVIEGPHRGKVLADVPWGRLCKRNGSPLG